MAKLNTAQRKALPKSSFVFPEQAPGSGSYPIPDESHARDALARSSGKPEEKAVSAAVGRKFPNIKRHSDLKKMWSKKEDDAYDKKKGIKENSSADKKEDAAHGIKD